MTKTNLEYIHELVAEINKNSTLLQSNHEATRKWIPKKEVKTFLGYGETQLISVTRKHNLIVSKIGRWNYYQTASLLKMLHTNRIK
jgi:hypothetical protein